MESIVAKAEVISIWINSSKTDQHLDACRDMIYVLAERFVDHHNMPEIKEMLLQKLRKRREELQLSNPLK